jgi:hypothetical protein
MAGSACGTNCGIGRERDKQKLVARAIAQRAWSPDEPPVSWEERSSIACALEDVLPARAFVTEAFGGCDAIALLAGTHDPCLLELRERGRIDAGANRERETYVRVLFSPLGRYYTLQEIVLESTRESDGVFVEERRWVGIEDRRLQLFVKATQGLLRKRKLIGLDAAFLSEPVSEGSRVTLWNALFERDDAGSCGGVFVRSG